jgi:hypothetical protein
MAFEHVLGMINQGIPGHVARRASTACTTPAKRVRFHACATHSHQYALSPGRDGGPDPLPLVMAKVSRAERAAGSNSEMPVRLSASGPGDSALSGMRADDRFRQNAGAAWDFRSGHAGVCGKKEIGPTIGQAPMNGPVLPCHKVILREGGRDLLPRVLDGGLQVVLAEAVASLEE